MDLTYLLKVCRKNSTFALLFWKNHRLSSSVILTQSPKNAQWIEECHATCEKSRVFSFSFVAFWCLLRWLSFVRRTLDSNQTQTKCCSGLCIDLLTKFEDELGFTYDLVRVPDPKWGTFEVSFLNSKLSLFFQIDFFDLYIAWLLEWPYVGIGQQKNRLGAVSPKNQCGTGNCGWLHYAILGIWNRHCCSQKNGYHFSYSLFG